MKTKLLTLLLAAAILVPCLLSLSGCSVLALGALFSEDETTDENGQNEKDDVKTTAESNQSNKHKMNEEVFIGDLSYTVIDVYDTQSTGYLYDTENNFVVVTVKIKNNGNESITITGSYVTYCVGDKKYEPHTAGIELDNGFYALKEIAPDLTVTLDFVFEIPKEHTANDYLQVKAKSYSSKTESIYLTE